MQNGLFKYSGIRLLSGLVILFILINTSAVNGQVTMAFRNNSFQSLKPELLLDLIINSSSTSDIKCYIEGEVTNRAGSGVMHFRTNNFNLHNGSNITSGATLGMAGISFSNDYVKTAFARNGVLPPDNYVYCVSLIQFEGPSLAKICGEINVIPGLLELISPSNGEHILTKYPVLVWHGQGQASSASGNLNYELKLVEIRATQSPIAAIAENPALLYKKYIPDETLLYPPEARPLETGKTYAWQVTAYFGQTQAGKTEVWSFSLDSGQNIVQKTPGNSYVLLKKNVDGGYTQFTNEIKFKVVTNDYGQKPEIKILSEDRKDLTPDNLQVVQEYGENLYTIDLTPYSQFRKNQFYTLELRTGRNEMYIMKFKYDKKHQNGKKGHVLIKKDF